MNRVDILEEVKKRIEKDGVIQYKYTDGTCFCAVGHIMSVCGIDTQQLLVEEELNKKSIDFLINDEPYLETVHSPIAEKLEEAGFTPGELRKLQEINDNYYDDADRKVEVITVIEDMMR